jgi:mxaL protein
VTPASAWRALRASGAAGLLAAAALALGITFLQPHLTLTQATHDLVVVLDVTQSMDADDMQQDGQPATRLQYAKWALDKVLHKLPCGSRIGWGVFTEYRSFLLLEPIEVCEHQRELLATLAQISGRMAWTGNSEVAKGLYSGIGIAKALPSQPALVFVTDGNEAPPLHPQYRPSREGAERVVRGLVLGLGGPRPAPIPKHDELGRPLGYWGADEVVQVEQRSRRSDGAVPPGVMLGATPGSEHLSGLREPYLQLLAGEVGLQYARLGTPEALYDVLTAPALAHPAPARADLRWPFALVALLALLAVYVPALARRAMRPHR